LGVYVQNVDQWQHVAGAVAIMVPVLMAG